MKRNEQRLDMNSADLLTLREIGPWINTALSGLLTEAIAKSEASKIELAVHEICVNIVEHAYHHTPGPISIEIGESECLIDVTITDNGEGFDPAEIIEPDPANPTVRGYGLMITRQLTSSLRYSQSSAGNRWDLSFPVPNKKVESPLPPLNSAQKGPVQ
jgi:serine/threonine-protein kinase RsbW